MDEAEVARWFQYEATSDLYAAIGSGLVTIAQIAGRLSAAQVAAERALPKAAPDTPDAPVLGSVSVLGVGDLLTRMGECCNPLPGDEIEGFITRTRGVTVHKMNCPNVRNVTETDRIVPVTWGQSRNVFPARILIECFDRVGLLHDITGRDLRRACEHRRFHDGAGGGRARRHPPEHAGDEHRAALAAVHPDRGRAGRAERQPRGAQAAPGQGRSAKWGHLPQRRCRAERQDSGAPAQPLPARLGPPEPGELMDRKLSVLCAIHP